MKSLFSKDLIVSSSSMNFVKFSKQSCVKRVLFNGNVFIDLVQSITEKPTLSMTDLLNTSSNHPSRSRDRGLKKVPKITSTLTIKNPVRSPAPTSSATSPDTSHRSSC